MLKMRFQQYPVKSVLTDIKLASFFRSYTTAENLLTRAAVQAGGTVLETGASCGLGSAAVQLAAVLEPEVVVHLVGRIERRDIAPLDAETFPMREIGAAQHVFGKKVQIGKTVLDLS
ncbi:hypothetical protein SAMN04488523_102335 [Sulfitobacter brevis]|uniref:Uncharacterized protein n=2 Tax=Sulfitobacter brevis TaxID=74348 RepID=A0A1I1V6S9_9RHOB|nr:hypothetical protein SAMN04488523_102335 [Sulfitobacter brevis]